MPATAARPPLHARYGITTRESFFDMDSRRHLMPSVMDDVPLLLERCACPGPRAPESIQCILPYTNLDHLCDACRTHCHGDLNGKSVHFIEGFGPAYHFTVDVAPEPATQEMPIQAPPPPKPAPTPPPAPPTTPQPVPPDEPAGPVVVDADAPGVILWAPNLKGARLHAYTQRTGFMPRSLCNQAHDRSWDAIKRRAGTALDLPICKSCVRLANR